MKNLILILTNSSDGIHSDIIVEKLLQRGENVFRFDVDMLVNGDTSIHFSANEDVCILQIRGKDYLIRGGDVKSVWYRRPNVPTLAIANTAQREHAEREVAAFLEGLWCCLGDVLWVSPFSNIRTAHYKLYQLHMAARLGLKYPETLISNNPDDVREFCARHEAVVFKTISHNRIASSEKVFHIPTTLITEHHLLKIDLVRRAPCLFQVCVKKSFEVRVTYVGGKFFASKISPKHEPNDVDWRKSVIAAENASYEKISLPADIQQKCQSMMAAFGLSYGAFDFIVDAHDQWYFLEINPIGQWYWVEERLGLTISDEIVNLLVGVSF